jgi:thioredoxin reductase (NADPH)
MSVVYDVIIIGGGPGGLSAGIYTGRGKLKTLLIEKNRSMGGQCGITAEVENYPGFLETSGPVLMDAYKNHADRFNVEYARGEVEKIIVTDDGFLKKLITKEGAEYTCKALIISPGAEPRILGLKGEMEFRGKGVSYCATCDGAFYEELDVAVIGGGNTAVEEACYLTQFAEKVYLIHRRDQFRADPIAVERALANPKIIPVMDSVVEEICGDKTVNKVIVRNVKTENKIDIACDGVFIFAGTIPKTGFLKNFINLTESGYIITNCKQETNIPGVYGVGDACEKFLRQIVTAAADGAIAAMAAGQYIAEENYTHKNIST